MRFVFAAFGSRGDVQPMLALALALKVRGHEVTVCVPPDYAIWVAELGLAGHSIGGSFREFMWRATQGLAGIRYVMNALPELVAVQYREIEPYAQHCDVMLGSSLTAAGASFAEKFGIRYHYVAFTPSVLPSSEYPSLFVKSQSLPRWVNRASWWLSKLQNNAGLGPAVNAERKRLGLPRVNDTWRHLLHEKMIVAADPALGPLPSDAPSDVIQTGSWFFDDPTPLPDAVEQFLQAGTPPVYVGFGSMRTGSIRGTIERVFEAVKRAGLRAIVMTGVAELKAPPEVLVIEAAPHGKLFPRCAAIVHHGGSGTTAAATRAGVPQLIIPQMTDQFYWRQRMLERQVVPSVVRLQNTEEFAAAMRVCVDDTSLKERARQLSSKLIVDGVARTVRVLETSESQLRPLAQSAEQ